MANQRNTNQRRPASGASSGRRNPRQQSSRRPASRRRTTPKPSLLSKLMALRPKPDFKPDSETVDVLKILHLTQAQRDKLLKWGLYIAILVVLCMIQDVIMSQVTIFGATTDLVACAILLITVIEGIDVGSLFVLIASTLYYFSGNAPSAFCIGLLTFFGIGATLFRQMFWHRSKGSVILCAAIAMFCYEIGLFVVGVTTALTHWGRLPSFVLTAVYSCLVMIPLYSLIYKIGLIGGNTWKE